MILVCSRPRADEAYWVSIRDYFAEPQRKASKTIRFSKADDAFDLSAKERIKQIAVPSDGGFYLGLQPRRETLFSDLLPVREFPNRFYRARAFHSSRKEALHALYGLDRRASRKGLHHHDDDLLFLDLSERWWERSLREEQ